MINILSVLAIFVVTFYLIYRDEIDRTVVILLGAFEVLVIGIVLRFYDPFLAYRAIHFETLFLIIGMSLFAALLDKAGFFQYTAKRIALYSRGDPWFILILFSLLTYTISLFVNNLTTIIVIIPITLNLTYGLRVNPIPIIISEVISSNLGGASSMVGDFPNMVIASATGIGFHEFLLNMMPMCLVLLAALLLYVAWRWGANPPDSSERSRKRKKKILLMLRQELKNTRWDQGTIQWGGVIFGLMILGFIFSGWIGWNPAFIALGGGILFWAVAGNEYSLTAKDINVKEIFFLRGYS